MEASLIESDAVLRERIRPNDKSYTDFSQIFGAASTRLNDATTFNNSKHSHPPPVHPSSLPIVQPHNVKEKQVSSPADVAFSMSSSPIIATTDPDSSKRVPFTPPVPIRTTSLASTKRPSLETNATSTPVKQVQFVHAEKPTINQSEISRQIDELQKSLLDCSLYATSVENKFKEGKKFASTVHQVKAGREKDAFHSRVQDIVSSIESTADDAAVAMIIKDLAELHELSWVLHGKLGKLLGFNNSKPPLLAGTKLRMKKQKYLDLVEDLHVTWTKLMLQVTLVISKSSSKDAQSATTHVHQLAIATGAPDWEDVTFNDATALYLQGDKYLLGYGLPKSYDMAYKRYLSAAEAGVAEASNMLGTLFENGLGKSKDLVLATKYYKLSASKGCSDAMNNLGRIYQNGIGCKIDYHLAKDCYYQGAIQGNVDCMVNLGNMLEDGLGCEEDAVMAFQWYMEAANKDFSKAQNAVGSCFYKGIGHERDYEKAVLWFRKSAEQGFAAAFNNLGICYEEGLGVAMDLGLAKQFYKDACLLMHPSGTNNYGYMLLLEKNYDEAIRHFHLAMALGCPEGAYNLGTLYESGVSNYNNELGMVNRDLEMAAKYFKWAADKDHIKAQLRLGALYLSGPESMQSHSKALEYLTMSAESNEAEAQNLLGQMKELGMGRETNIERVMMSGLSKQNSNHRGFLEGAIRVEPDYHEARKWYKRAMAQGHAVATYNLGSLYECGLGVERDMERAAALYAEATKRGCQDARDRLYDLAQIGLVDSHLLDDV